MRIGTSMRLGWKQDRIGPGIRTCDLEFLGVPYNIPQAVMSKGDSHIYDQVGQPDCDFVSCLVFSRVSSNQRGVL